MTNLHSKCVYFSALFLANWAIAGELTAVDSKTEVAASAPRPRLTLSGWIEAGMTVNFAAPEDRQNFGRLLDDRSNEPLLNQFAVVLERSLDPAGSNSF